MRWVRGEVGEVGEGGGGGGGEVGLGMYTMPQVDVLFFLQVIGVAQVINKSKGEEVFTSKDEEVKKKTAIET